YRDGCKRSQPLSTRREERGAESPVADAVPRPVRRKLPDERRALTHKFSINGHEGYITVGLYEDGQPGEIFLTMAKEGSTISGLMDAFATSISLALQYGVPLKALVDKFSHMRFEPSGFTRNPEIPIAKSITDYIFRWLASRFLTSEEKQAVGVILAGPEGAAEGAAEGESTGSKFTVDIGTDAPSCHECGSIMVRNGSCYKCNNCGSTSGCS
ncbi:MAG TPA: vitamin B12-dependent ribonucleotide reductase, partial [Thermoanaerobaculia bacterium]|nr:vitamin B12-dependent ribonucleotide reductase [Thermoanaerobaculia bacterium]